MLLTKYKILIILAVLAGTGWFSYNAGHNAAAVSYEKTNSDAADALTEAHSAEIVRLKKENATKLATQVRVAKQLKKSNALSEKRLDELRNKEYPTCDGQLIISTEWLWDFNTGRTPRAE